MNASTDSTRLPELSDERVDELERALFSDIAAERAGVERRRVRRGRIWMAGGAAAAVVAVAAIIAPSVGGLVGGSSGADSAAVQPASGGGYQMLPEGTVAVDESAPLDGAKAPEAVAEGTDAEAGREIVTTASVSLTVDDVSDAADDVATAADAVGGYVASMNVGSSGAVPVDPGTGIVYDMPVSPPDGAWVTVRVPSDALTAYMADVRAMGEVTSSNVDRQDVTDQAVDLDARITAAQASVERLTQLMAQAGDLSDLIAAESALAERQAELESLQQQRDALGSLVEMSSVSVSLSPVVETVTADPAGFGDGLLAGWNGLVATLNGVVVALGFLLPWLVVAAAVWLVVWAILRARRRRGIRRSDEAVRRRAAESAARETAGD